MKVARLGRPRPVLTLAGLSGGSDTPGQGLVSTGSNGTTEWVNIIQRITADGNAVNGPFVNFAAGSNITLTRDAGPLNSVPSNTIRIHATSGGSLTVEEVDGSPTDSAVTKIVFPNGTLGIASHVATYTPSGGGGGPSDYVSGASGTGQIIIPGLNASPDKYVGGGSDDDFDSTDTTDPITGWTTIGTPTTLDTNSTAKSHLYIKKNGGPTSMEMHGIYKAASPAFTVVTKLSAHVLTADFGRAGLFISTSSPGACVTLDMNYASGNGVVDVVAGSSPTNFTTIVGTVTLNALARLLPMWFKIVAASSSNVTFQYSGNGLLWYTLASAYNPGFTIGSVGFFCSPQNGSASAEALFDYYHIS